MQIPGYLTDDQSDGMKGVDRYKLIEQLGEGGMGVVWRALDRKTGGEVAIKIMKDISDPECLDLFTKEWKTLSYLCHPNIVDVRDVDTFQDNGEQKPFFVMPLLRGVTLAELIGSASERLTCARVVEIFSQVCRGLQAAHQHGLIHRDLKPSNIFVMHDDTAKIIDFGIVHLAGANSVPGQKGTFQYMAPEQILMKEIAEAADIFALGVSLYEALTARKPFARPTVEETIQAVLNEVPPPVSELNPAIPYTISQVVHKCIAKQAVNRFLSAREVAEMLGKAVRNEAIFDLSQMRDRLERIRTAIKTGDLAFASELLVEIESEGHVDPELTYLHSQVELAVKKRRIDHLLSAAKSRIEQGEIPLGLEKLRELLDLDPENIDALALKARAEKQRSEALVLKWIELAQTHLANRDFAAARNAATEALSSRDGEPRALDLLRKIDSMEADAKRIREQKEQLYVSALRDYQNGEIESALSRLGRLFSVLRSHPEGAAPERDAVYENLYKEVCSEHDLIRAKIEEAQRLLADEQFSPALLICAEQLAKFPASGSFQALKIQIEDAERQKISADLAITSRNADAEPDLDRRANIWREAAERYPNDAQFAQQMRVACERRDLVNSIVAKAHQFGELGMHAEELAQWEMLRNIHPRYPGLSFELEQCRRRRDQQVRNEQKAHVVEEIVRLMEVRQFKEAQERARFALCEYPNDNELSGLETLSMEALERTSECNRIFLEAQQEADTGNHTRATALLKEALRMDPRNAEVQDTLIHLLIEQERHLLETELERAEGLHKEAEALNANHRLVRSFGIELAQTGRQRRVSECLTRARGLIAMGEASRAWECIQLGMESFPGETRLQQVRDQLVREYPELLATTTLAAAPEPGQPSAAPLPEVEFSEEHAPLPGNGSAEVRLGEAIAEACAENCEVPPALAATSVFPALVCPTHDLGTGESTRIHSLRGHAIPESAANAQETEPAASGSSRRPSPRTRSVRWRNGWAVAIACCFVVFAVAVVWLHSSPSKTKVQNATLASFVTVRLTVSPVDSAVRLGGVPQDQGEIRIPTGEGVSVEVSHPGYRSRIVQLSARQEPSTVVLEPLPVRISVRTTEKVGQLEIDGTKIGELVDGSLDAIEVPADGSEHELVFVVDGRPVKQLRFQADPGMPPVLRAANAARDLKDVILVLSMGPKAVIYSTGDVTRASFRGQPVAVGTSGVEVSLTSSADNELKYRFKGEPRALSLEVAEAPSLSVRWAEAQEELLITSNVEGATLTANGKPVSRAPHGWHIAAPGTYNLVLSADNYQPQSWTTVLKAHQTMRQERILVTQAATAPMLSPLILSSGTPGALVILDGTIVGELDGNGAAQFRARLTPGRHQVNLRKNGFCSEHNSEVNAIPPAEVHLDGIVLEPCAHITLQANTGPATVMAIHEGDVGSKWVSLIAGQSLALPAGTYHLAVQSEGKPSYNTEVRLEAGKNLNFSPQLTPLQDCHLENSSSVLTDGDWIKPKNRDDVVYLNAGCARVTLIFRRPKASFLGKRRVGWMLEIGTGRIGWTLDGEKLIRKSTAQQSSDRQEVDVRSVFGANAEQYTLRLHIAGSRVDITNADGSVLDSYLPKDPTLKDISAAKLGVKTSAGFKFDSAQQ